MKFLEYTNLDRLHFLFFVVVKFELLLAFFVNYEIQIF